MGGEAEALKRLLRGMVGTVTPLSFIYDQVFLLLLPSLALTYTQTHTHVCTHTHARMHAHSHTHTRTHTRSHTGPGSHSHAATHSPALGQRHEPS